jgi:2-polyprenyl-3-methyl-5-hydroxy-6-metoxy-1,4-benzoquinol methylase
MEKPVRELPTTPTSADVLLANQLYYGVEAPEYDQKNHVKNEAILRYYHRLFARHVFGGVSADQIRNWIACDVGCGTGFIETLIAGRVRRMIAFDATHRMLAQAKAKGASLPVTWIQADAQALPVDRSAFDLVCSNAMLHHVYGYERVLSSMIAMLKPGGRLFVGYEPNAIPYRMLWPLLKLAAKIVPEHRQRHAIREASGQAAHPSLNAYDIHELSEFHIFHGTGEHGIDPFRLQALAARQGMADCRIHFSSVYQFALLRDAGVPIPMQVLPDWFFRLSGRLSLSFSLTATKAFSV